MSATTPPPCSTSYVAPATVDPAYLYTPTAQINWPQREIALAHAVHLAENGRVSADATDIVETAESFYSFLMGQNAVSSSDD